MPTKPPEHITVRSVLACVRPVVFANDDTLHPYSALGSCIVIAYMDRLFAVTAGHVVKTYEDRQVCIPYSVGSHSFLPIKEAFRIITNLVDDSDHTDIVIYEMDRRQVDDSLWTRLDRFDLSWNRKAFDSQPLDYLLVGFPAELNGVDFECHKIYNQRLTVSAQLIYVDRFEFVNELTLGVDSHVNDLNGFSGGAVFSVSEEVFSSNRVTVNLEGMILRGSAESRSVYYLQISAIEYYLRNACEADS